MWHYAEAGAGRPLILLHGIGMSHAVWNPVIPLVSPTRRVIAFDTAGFGATPAFPSGTLPTILHLVDGLERSLHELGIVDPIDVAGNSLGGTMALEAARRGIARSVVAISPACLWKEHDAAYVTLLLKTLRFTARRFPHVLQAAVEKPSLRELLFAVPISLGGRRMSVSDALRIVDDLAHSPGFEQTFDNTRAPFSATDITVPVTVAFGDRDWILPKGSRCREQLPVQVRWVEKRGWGHVPMWADPAGVSELILQGIA